MSKLVDEFRRLVSSAIDLTVESTLDDSLENSFIEAREKFEQTLEELETMFVVREAVNKRY